MSRVFDTPRYSHQCAYKTLSAITSYLHREGKLGEFKKVSELFYNEDIRQLNPQTLALRLGEVEAFETSYEESSDIPEYSADDLFAKYQYTQGCNNADSRNPLQPAAAGKVLYDLITSRAKFGRPVYSDWDGMIRIVEGYLSGKYVATMKEQQINVLKSCKRVATDIVAISMNACRLGKKSLEAYLSNIFEPGSQHEQWMRMKAWNMSFEFLRLMGSTPESSEAAEDVRDGSMTVNYMKTSVVKTRGGMMSGSNNIFRLIGLWVFEYHDAIYILDYSAMDQVHGVSKFWEGCWTYSMTYRISGGSKEERSSYQAALERSQAWVAATLRSTGHSDRLARSMKQSLALLQNELHTSAEKLQVGWESKSSSLRVKIAEILPLKTYWHDFVKTLGLTDRVELDIAHVYYGLPAPDCDVRMLVSRATEYMEKAKTADPTVWRDFMAYCKSADLSRVLSRCKSLDQVSYRTVDGYTLENQDWVKKCFKGSPVMPPEEDIGKAWLYNHFEFTETIHHWYFEAADVTHVNADKQVYDSVQASRTQDRSDHNELLYALEHAPYLSKKYSPIDILNELEHGVGTWDRIAVMAAKSENTKPGSNVRETWSGDDITRELTSMCDRAGIALARLYRGVTARKSDIEVNRIFDRICEFTKPGNTGLSAIISNDVSGWSPLGDREAWLEHHDYVLHTTKCPKWISFKKIWDRIRWGINKRGVVANEPLDKGLFQGWTGTMDSIMNVQLSLYCVRVAKREGTVLATEGATTAGLIDDAVQAVEFSKDMSHAQKAADVHFETTQRVWRAVGAEIDPVKTIYSSSKFIYLNRFFCEGSEVLVPMKVFAKADREMKRRFSGIFSQFDTVLGSFRAASEKGACPIAAYHCAVMRVMELAERTSTGILKKGSVELINSFFSPRGLGGWGLPHLVAWLTQESPDSLTSYITVIASAVETFGSSSTADNLSSRLYDTISQQLEEVNPTYFLSSPRDVKAVGVKSPEVAVFKKLKAGMSKRCKSQVFRTVLSSMDNSYLEDSLRDILQNSTWDASILELLGQCVPSACASALVDRAYKNDLVSTLFPFRVRSELSAIVRKTNKQSLTFLMRLAAGTHESRISRQEAFATAHDLRETFYSLNDVSIVNHTLPDYGTALARQETATATMLTATKTACECSCPSEGQGYCDMYNGRVAKPLRIKTKGAYTFTGEVFKSMDVVERCVQKAAMTAAYLQSVGSLGELFWLIVSAAWGIQEVLEYPISVINVAAGTSTKRISPSLSSRSHPIACYPNTQSSVQVDAQNLGRYLSRSHTHTDLMSFLTAARCVVLLETTLTNCDDLVLHYAVLPDSIPDTDDRYLCVSSPLMVDSAIRQLRSSSKSELSEAFLSAMTIREMSVDDDELFLRVYHRTPGDVVERAVGSAVLREGVIAKAIMLSAPSTVGTSSMAPRVGIVGDEVRPTLGVTADSRFRHYCGIVSKKVAAFMLLMDLVRQQTGKRIPDVLVLSKWKDVGTVVIDHMQGWHLKWMSAIGATISYETNWTIPFVSRVMGEPHRNVARAVVSGDRTANEWTAEAYGRILLMSHGRLPTPGDYMLTAAYGPKFMSRCWDMAARRCMLFWKKIRNARDDNRRLMTSVYRRLATFAKSYTPETGTRVEGVSAICAAIESEFGGEDPEDFITQDPRSYLDGDPSDMGKRLAATVIRYVSRVQPTVRLNQEYLANDFGNLLGDILHLGRTDLLQGYEPDHLHPVGIPPQYIIPEIELPEVIGGDEPEAGEDVDPRTKRATQIYISLGEDSAYDYWTTGRDTDLVGDFEVSVDEIEEWVSTAASMSTGDDGGADEADWNS